MKRLLHRQLYCCEGRVIGTICDVVTAGDDVLPRWLVVDTGVLEPRCIVPGGHVTDTHGRLSVPFTADVVKGCPVDPERAPLDARATEQLQRHYGLVADRPTPGQMAGGPS